MIYIPHPVQDFLDENRVGVLAVEMMDGSPHGATIHFAHTINLFEFYIITNRNYRKAEPMLASGYTRASLVIGFSESIMKSLQLDGEVGLVDRSLVNFQQVYLVKFPDRGR